MDEDTLAPEGANAEPEALSENEEAQTEAVEADEQTADEAQTDEGDGGEAEDEANEEVAEEVEFTFGHDKLSVRASDMPAEVAEKLNDFTKRTWADYTRKTQEVADERKAVQAEREAAEKLRSLEQKDLQVISLGMSLNAEIQQLEGLDWNRLWQQTPDEARRLDSQLTRKRSDLQKVIAENNRLESEKQTALKEQRDKQSEEGKATLEKRIQGFKADEVVDYVVGNYGMDRAVAERDWSLNPAITEMAHKAMLYDRVQAKAKAAADPKTPTTQPVKTTAKKGGGSGRPVPFSAADPNGDSISDADEWAKRYREHQAKRKRA